MSAQIGHRLFIGHQPAAIVYTDRHREVDHDYAKLAVLPYGTLKLAIEPDCPPELRAEIEAHAALVIAQRGQPYRISAGGPCVTLGRPPENPKH